MRLPRSVLLFTLASVLVLPAAARQEPQFRTRSDLVVLHASVTDRRGAFVDDLDERAFHLFEDGRPRDVSFFRKEDQPATIGLIVDSSASMFQVRPLVIAASRAFVQVSNHDDEFFALAFNNDVTPALPEDDPFTSDPATFSDALASVITAHGRTKLFDAISAAIDYGARGSHVRKALVVISDGGDNASRTTLSQLAAKVQTSNVVLYTVALVDPVDEEARPEQLRELAKVTGGLSFEPKALKDVGEALNVIARNLRHSYVLGYVPGSIDDGRLHQLRVTVSMPGRSGLKVRTRSVYLAWPTSIGP